MCLLPISVMRAVPEPSALVLSKLIPGDQGNGRDYLRLLMGHPVKSVTGMVLILARMCEFKSLIWSV